MFQSFIAHLAVRPYEVFVDVRARHLARLEQSVQLFVRVVVLQLLLLLSFANRWGPRVRASSIEEEQIVERLYVVWVVTVAGVICFPRLIENRAVLQSLQVPQPASTSQAIGSCGGYRGGGAGGFGYDRDSTFTELLNRGITR